MTTGMILNAIVCWAIFFVAFLTATNIFYHRKGKIYSAFALFWLLAGVLWFQAGLRQYFAWRGEFALDQQVFLLDQVLVFTHYLPLVYFIFYLVFHKKIIANIFSVLFAIISALALYSLKFGFTAAGINYFSTKYISHSLTQMIFSYGFAILFLLIIFVILREAYGILKKKNKDYANLLAFISIIAYFGFGYLDQMAIFSNWYLIIVRLCILASVAVGYFSYTHMKTFELAKK